MVMSSCSWLLFSILTVGSTGSSRFSRSFCALGPLAKLAICSSTVFTMAEFGLFLMASLLLGVFWRRCGMAYLSFSQNQRSPQTRYVLVVSRNLSSLSSVSLAGSSPRTITMSRSTRSSSIW
uniref:Putative secreted protein n=1 Tax=Ixodes ricinus TaxID=34613 RepID=A0A6B0UNM5_IXORI